MKGWVKDAARKDELKITAHRNCPFCNPERRTDVPTSLNACENHKWVNKEWYEARFTSSS